MGYERGKVLARRGMVLEAFLGLSDTDWLAFTAIFTAFLWGVAVVAAVYAAGQLKMAREQAEDAR